MKAKFIGDPTQPGEAGNLPETFEAHGLTFEKNKFTEVPAHLEAKFVGNPHFKVQGAAESDEGKAAVEETK
jgi:hypothetical protein